MSTYKKDAWFVPAKVPERIHDVHTGRYNWKEREQRALLEILLEL